MAPELEAQQTLVGVTLVLYVAGLFALSFWVRGRIHDAEDYIVAGRRLPLSLSTATLFATWFGAGTLLAATDEVRHEGLGAAALDPLGAGTCLLLAGLFFAAPLWRMRLLTLGDFYRARFGPRAEVVASAIMVPGYFGWIAAQFVALASVLELYFGLDLRIGIVLVAVVGAGYTLVGGMWSVTLTDAVQLALVLVGLGVLGVTALHALGGDDLSAGWHALLDGTPAPLLEPVPRGGLRPLLSWLGLFCAGALGNLPGQDLMQRVFAARSPTVARRACLLAGAGYLLFGAVPVLLGLAARILAPEGERATLPLLAGLLLSPPLTVIFVLTVFSAVLSTIDSAILAPASVLSENLFPKLPLRGGSLLQRSELAVALVAGASLVVAFLGESAWSLLESAYELGLVSLLVPLAFGLFGRRGGEAAALAAMVVGTSLWLLHLLLGWEWFAAPVLAARGIPLPMGLGCAAASLAAYTLVASRERVRAAAPAS